MEPKTCRIWGMHPLLGLVLLPVAVGSTVVVGPREAFFKIGLWLGPHGGVCGAVLARVTRTGAEAASSKHAQLKLCWPVEFHGVAPHSASAHPKIVTEGPGTMGRSQARQGRRAEQDRLARAI